jgi:hypothetical protein
MTLNVGSVITDIYVRNEIKLPRLRIGDKEKSILSFLLKNGAKTSYELALQIENIDVTRNSTKAKSFFRTIKQLREKYLITCKPYFKYTHGFCIYMENNFWAEGSYWKRNSGNGFLRTITKPQNYGNFHIYGLTSEGKKQILKRLSSEIMP